MAIVWWATPSSVFLRPVGLSVSPALVVSSVRDVPAGQVSADWWAEVRTEVIECQASGGPVTYQTGRLGERYGVQVSYMMHPRLSECVPRRMPFTISQVHKVYLGGVVPLRSSEVTWHCVADGTPCVPVN